jgi:hypothetical protein
VTSAADIVCLDVRGLANGNDGSFTDEARYMAEPGKPPVKLDETLGDIIWRFDPVDELGVYPHDAASIRSTSWEYILTMRPALRC